VDVNPPLMTYLDLVPALLARLTGWSIFLSPASAPAFPAMTVADRRPETQSSLP
jgi:hypothetical protein